MPGRVLLSLAKVRGRLRFAIRRPMRNCAWLADLAFVSIVEIGRSPVGCVARPELRLCGKVRMHRLSTVLCTSGLAAEAKIARAAGFPVVIGAGDRERTAALVEKRRPGRELPGELRHRRRSGAESAPGRCGHLGRSRVATGIAGGRRTGFKPASPTLARQIGAFEGPVLGASAILATEEDKSRAWRETGALAVDLESAVVARIARTAGIPFLVAAHDRRHRVPGAAAGGADPAGRGRHARTSPASWLGAAPARGRSRRCSGWRAKPGRRWRR